MSAAFKVGDLCRVINDYRPWYKAGDYCRIATLVSDGDAHNKADFNGFQGQPVFTNHEGGVFWVDFRNLRLLKDAVLPNGDDRP